MYISGMDVSQALRDVENSVRNLIAYQLVHVLGKDWINKCGVSEERIKKWSERKEEELKRLGSTDQSLIYYSDFYDLLTILKKNWPGCFSIVFGKLSKFEVLWGILESFRNPEAHRREFLPYQVYLIIGISGKIRTEITSFFSQMDTGDSYFPRLESVQDNLGNSWRHGDDKELNTGRTLRPGDSLEITATAFDPLGEQLYYSFRVGDHAATNWVVEGQATLNVQRIHIGRNVGVTVSIHSSRDHQAYRSKHYDDRVTFIYTIIPKPTVIDIP